MENQATPPDYIRIEVEELKLQKKFSLPLVAWKGWNDGIYSLPWFTSQAHELRNLFFQLNSSHEPVGFYCRSCGNNKHFKTGLVIATESEKKNNEKIEENSSLSAISEGTIINFMYVKWLLKIKTAGNVEASYSNEISKPIRTSKLYESWQSYCSPRVNGDVQFVVDITFQRVVTGSSALGSPPVPGPLRTLGTLQRMLTSSASHDVQLTLQDGALSAHRAVLAASSDVFSAMFQHNFKESKKGEVAIPDIRVEVMRRALGFLYGEDTVMPMDDLFMCMELFVLADRYQFLGLKETCENAFACIPSLKQLELLLLADSNKVDSLTANILSRIVNDPDRKKLFDDGELQKISESHPQLLPKLLKALL